MNKYNDMVFYCTECGKDLDIFVNEVNHPVYGKIKRVNIEPCEECTDRAYHNGRWDGYYD
jgi:ribosomal protein L37E